MSRLAHMAFAVATALLPALPGCSVPDGDDLRGLRDNIKNMDPAARKAAKLEEARGRARKGLQEFGPDSWVGDIVCEDKFGHGVEQHIPADEILNCLAISSQATFATCVASRVADFTRAYIDAGPLDPSARCKFKPAANLDVDPKWDPDQITDEDLANSAFASTEGPPAWMIAAGVVGVGVGGVLTFAPGWVLVLCPLDLEWGCPGDPLQPGEGPEPGSTSVGDQ
jgi:hypothetical protein